MSALLNIQEHLSVGIDHVTSYSYRLFDALIGLSEGLKPGELRTAVESILCDRYTRWDRSMKRLVRRSTSELNQVTCTLRLLNKHFHQADQMREIVSTMVHKYFVCIQYGPQRLEGDLVIQLLNQLVHMTREVITLSSCFYF